MKKLINSLLYFENDVIKKVIRSSKEKEGLLLTYFDVNSLNVTYKNKEFQKLLDNHFSLYSDGTGIFYFLKYLLKIKLDKFNGSDLNLKILLILEKVGIKYFFIGGNFKQQLIANKMNGKNFFVGYYPGFNIIFDNLVNEIKNKNPNVILVGMGIPLQEELSYKLSLQFPKITFICVGNFLEFYFGTKKRAPRILHNSGFEWFFRLLTEPKRLWQRYLIGIPLFIFRVIKIKLTNEKR